MSFVKLNGRTYPKGSRITLNNRADDFIPGVWPGLSVRIHSIRSGNSSAEVGLESDEPISGWGDLNDRVEHRHGWWIKISQLEKCIITDDLNKYEVSKSMEYRGVELEGMAGHIIAHIDNGKIVFIEFDNHVGGCSADGHGKMGHCVALPLSSLKKLPPEKKEAQSKSKKKKE